MAEPFVVHVDSALTDFAVAHFMEPNAFVARRAFPAIPVGKQSDKYFVWTRADLLRAEAQKRAAGTPVVSRTFAATDAQYFANVWAIKTAVSEQDAKNADPGLNLEESKLKGLVQDIHIREELEFATVAFASSWGTNGAPSVTWENAASYPIKDFGTAIRTIQYNTGRIANKAVLGAETWYSGLLNHSDIIDRMPDNAPRIATPNFVANVLGLQEVLVATAGYNSATEGATASYSSILGDSALIMYVDPNPSPGVATAGATFVWSGLEGAQDGMRVQREFIPREDAMPELTVESAFVHKIVASELGYYFYTCIT